MAVGNGTYESIPDSENGGSTTTRGGSNNKWCIGSAVLIAVVGAVYGATTYINNNKMTSSDDFLKAIAGTTTTDSNGKLKLFDSMSTSRSSLTNIQFRVYQSAIFILNLTDVLCVFLFVTFRSVCIGRF